MVNYVEYKGQKNKKKSKLTFAPLSALTYELTPRKTVSTQEVQIVIPENVEPIEVNYDTKEQVNPKLKSKLDKVIDYALSKANKDSTHYCARYVRQALESQGFTPGKGINGWEYEKAAKNMGWHEVTDGTIKKGDLIVTKKHDGKGHVALATKDNADIFNDRTSSVSDFVSRGVPYNKNSVKSVKIFRAQKGMKWATYNPSPKIKEIFPFNFLQVPENVRPLHTRKITSQSYLVYAEPIEEEPLGPTTDFEQDYTTYSGPVTRELMEQLYSKALAEKGIDQKYVKYLVAHDMLESGKNFSHQSGKFNFGGIKGKGTLRKTMEERNGKKVSTAASFKDYKHPYDYVQDKVRLMDERYKAFNGGNYIDAVIRGGYATDSSYKSKYLKLFNSI